MPASINDPFNKRERRHVRDNDPVMSNRDWGVDLPEKFRQLVADINECLAIIGTPDAVDVVYDDLAVAPPLGATNVQDALDAIKLLLAEICERCVYVAFSYTDSSPIAVTVQAAGELIVETDVVITTAFTDPAATLLLGSPATPGLVFDTNEVKPKKVGQFHSESIVTAVGATTIQIALSPGTSTAGAGFVLLKLKKV